MRCLLPRGSWFGLLALSGAASASSPSTPQADAPPNVLVILADDLGYGDVGAFAPDSRIPTPHLDRLAREGMRFTDAHAPGAWCTPSRYGLLTGRYPARKRAFRAGKEAVLAPERLTLPAFLGAQGYATAMVGKWHLGFDGGPQTDGAELTGGPVDRGFDRFFGIHASLDIPPYCYLRDRAPVTAPTGTVEASATEGWSRIQGAFWREGAMAPDFRHDAVLDVFRDETLAVLEERARAPERPFFLYLALTAPHTPWLPDEAHRGVSGAGMYGDFVAQVDTLVGAVLDALDANGQTENTLVVFTSDNGPVWYPVDVEKFGHRASGPFRGMKSDAWEGGHRMPFLVRWPGQVPAGTACARTIGFTDLFATLAEIARAPLPDDAAEDSISILPLLRDPHGPATRDHLVLKADASAVRAGKWKLITHLGSGGFSPPRRIEAEPDGPHGQLYDLEADPGETRNLWSERPDVVRRLEGLLAAL